MSKEIEDKKKQLLDKSYRLRQVDTTGLSYNKIKEIRTEQTEAYNKLNFIKGLEKAMKGGNQ